MTSLLSGLMKISGKLPLGPTADAMLPSRAPYTRGGREEVEGGREREGRGGEGGRRVEERRGELRPRANEKFYENFRD